MAKKDVCDVCGAQGRKDTFPIWYGRTFCKGCMVKALGEVSQAPDRDTPYCTTTSATVSSMLGGKNKELLGIADEWLRIAQGRGPGDMGTATMALSFAEDGLAATLGAACLVDVLNTYKGPVETFRRKRGIWNKGVYLPTENIRLFPTYILFGENGSYFNIRYLDLVLFEVGTDFVRFSDGTFTVDTRTKDREAWA